MSRPAAGARGWVHVPEEGPLAVAHEVDADPLSEPGCEIAGASVVLARERTVKAGGGAGDQHGDCRGARIAQRRRAPSSVCAQPPMAPQEPQRIARSGELCPEGGSPLGVARWGPASPLASEAPLKGQGSIMWG